MDVRVDAVNADELKVKLSIVMPLRDWRALKEQLDVVKWPACDLSRVIRETLAKYEQTVFANQE